MTPEQSSIIIPMSTRKMFISSRMTFGFSEMEDMSESTVEGIFCMTRIWLMTIITPSMTMSTPVETAVDTRTVRISRTVVPLYTQIATGMA